MGQKTDSVPNEFTTFIRDAGIRAFDQLAGRFGSEGDAESKTSVQKLGNLWKGMEKPEKERFFEQLITAAQALALTAPVVIGLTKVAKAKSQPDAERSEGPASTPDESVTNGKKEKKDKKNKKDKKDKKDKDKKKKDKNGKKKKTRKTDAGFKL